MGLLDKAKNGIKTGVEYIGKGAKYVGQKITDVAVTIKDDFNEAKAERELTAEIKQQFNASATKFIMVTPGEHVKLTDIYAQVDEEEKTLVILEDIPNITNEFYFVDGEYRAYEIRLIKLKQEVDLHINNVICPRTVTLIEYELNDDEETKNQMQAIIYNN